MHDLIYEMKLNRNLLEARLFVESLLAEASSGFVHCSLLGNSSAGKTVRAFERGSAATVASIPADNYRAANGGAASVSSKGEPTER